MRNRSDAILAFNDRFAHAALILELEVVPGAAHPTVHPRGLPRRPEFLAAIRRHIAR